MCAHADATTRTLKREVTSQARLRRARPRPRCSESVRVLWKPATPSRWRSHSVRGRALTCQSRPPMSSRRARVRTRERATAHSLSGGDAASALAARARQAALFGVSPCPSEAHCAVESALSLGARSCTDVPAVASDEQPAFACAHTRTRHGALSLGRRRSMRACGVCAPRRAGWSQPNSNGRPLCHPKGSLSRCTAVLRRVNRGLQQEQPAFACAHTRTRHRALSLGLRRSTRACGVCALRRGD